MQYSLTVVPEHEFQDLLATVERSMKSRRSQVKFKPLDVQLVTGDVHEFDPYASAQEKRRTANSVGLAFPYQGKIWAKESRFPADIRITLLHELSHLAVPQEAHGVKWRQVFGVALILHLRDLDFPEDKIRFKVRCTAVEPYRKYRRWTPKGERNDIHNYYDNIKEEIDKLFRQADRVK